MIPYWVRTGDEFSVRKPAPDAKLRMAIVSCPRGDWRLEGEMRAIRKAGIDGLVSLLTKEENELLGLTGEGEAARSAGLRFWSIPVRDHGVPASIPDFAQLVEELRSELHEGKAIAVHCFAGIGRSNVLLGCILAMEGWNPDVAFDRLSEARGMPVPDTPEQEEWVREFAANLAPRTL